MNNKFLIHKETGSVIHKDNKRILHYAFDDFISCVVDGNDCFICGAKAEIKSFNHEHVIPKWVLKHYGTSKSFMILPNGTTIKNSAYTIPCCQSCNTELAKVLETPISELLKKGYAFVHQELANDDSLYLKLFHWWSCYIWMDIELRERLNFRICQKRESSTTGSLRSWL